MFGYLVYKTFSIFCGGLYCKVGFPGGSDTKESSCNAGDLGSIPGGEDPLEKGMAAHSTILVLPGESAQTEEPGRLQSLGSQIRTQLSNGAHTHIVNYSRRETNTYSMKKHSLSCPTLRPHGL